MRVTSSMILNLLGRDEDTGAALVHIVDACVDDRRIRALEKMSRADSETWSSARPMPTTVT